MATFVALEHGTYLCLVLQLGNLLVSESYQFHVFPYFFVQLKSALIFVTLHFGTRRVNASVVGKNTLRTRKLGLDLHADFDRKEMTFNLPPKT